MLRVIVFAFFMLVSFNLTAAPAVSFIEFTPIAAISDGYSFGISEIKVNKRTIYTVSFKKGKDVFAVTPENMLRGYYPDLTFTGLAINKNTIVIGGKERYSSNEPWIFMFKIQDKKISIADIITKATVNEYKYNFEYNLPSIDAPRSLPDVDKDKKAEIELDFYETGITLYAEIRDDSLNIDYSSSKYNDIFNVLDVMDEKDDYQFMQYLIYGALAGRLTRQQAEEMYISQIRESNLKLQQLIANMKRIKELSVQNNLSSQMVEYLSRDMEQDELFQVIDNLSNSKEFKKRILLLDEQLKLLKIDEVILNDFATYISGYLTNTEFADLLTIAVAPSYIDINTIISNIFILDNIMHKYGYKIIYLKASI